MFRHPMSWLGLALIIAILIFWDTPRREGQQSEPKTPLDFPQAYTECLETRVYNADGGLHYHMQARQAQHYQPEAKGPSKRDYSLIEQPDLTVYSRDANPWHLESERGRSEANGERVLLHEGVQAWQNGQQGRTELTTDQLWVEPGEEYAHTDKAVKMRAEQGVTTAVGMQARLGEKRIEFLSDVQSVYQDPEFSIDDGQK